MIACAFMIDFFFLDIPYWEQPAFSPDKHS